MKKIFFIFLIFICVTELYSQVTSPESIVWNEITNSYIISDAATGKLVSMDKAGNFSDFTTGLNHPKGLIFDWLSIWVTDVNQIVEIDPQSGDILNRYNILGSGSLNDIVADDMGSLYITDTQFNRVYSFDPSNGSYQIFSAGLVSSANGIFYDLIGGLYVVSFENNAKIYSIDISEGNVELLMQTQLSQLDGIAYDTKRDRYYISSWGSNSIYILDPSFEDPPVLLRSGLNGPADIYYDELTDSLVVPVMNTGQIVFIGFEKEGIEILGNVQTCEDSENTYKVESTSGKTNKWTINGGQIVGQSNLDSVNVLWGNAGTGKVKIVQTDNQTMTKDSLDINVNISQLPVVNLLGNINVCEGNTEKYYCQKQTGITKNWVVEGGEVIGNDDADTIFIKWKVIPEGEDSIIVTGFLTLEQTNNITGCSNTNFKKINISKKPLPEISGSMNVCVGDVENYLAKYEVDNSYEWWITGGTLIGDDKDTIVRIQWNQSGEATLTLIQTNNQGCTDTARIQITINPLPEKPVITQMGATLNSTPAVSYQWYRLNVLIPEGTAQFYNPKDSGTYIVEITDENGCKNISEPYFFAMLTVEDKLSGNDFLIYPQPVTNKLFFKMDFKSDVEISIYNILGIVIKNKVYLPSEIKEGIDVSSFNNGIYFIKTDDGQTVSVNKFVKE